MIGDIGRDTDEERAFIDWRAIETSSSTFNNCGQRTIECSAFIVFGQKRIRMVIFLRHVNSSCLDCATERYTPGKCWCIYSWVTRAIQIWDPNTDQHELALKKVS